MKSNSVHKSYILFLFFVSLLTFVTIGIFGSSYYFTPVIDRPFHSDYKLLKPSGAIGHGFGIIGSLMITIGVITYSSRKRIKNFSNVGKIKYFLEFHIFLCLLGPILVLYHTTFKFGGIVAISFWCMSAVVLSGIIGRYIYIQIPKNISGNELSHNNIISEYNNLADKLKNIFGFNDDLILKLDSLATPIKHDKEIGFIELFTFILKNDLTRKIELKKYLKELLTHGEIHDVANELYKVSKERLKLTRSIQLLDKLQKIFYLWHVVHLPFSIIMFLILLVHIIVTITFGYTWIF